jgi:hypothetical protein
MKPRSPLNSLSRLVYSGAHGPLRAADRTTGASPGRFEALKPVSVPPGVTVPYQDPSARIRDLWFSRSLDDRREACRRCRHCPIIHKCGAAAEANQERHGVWGGKDFTKADRPRRRGAA